MVAPAVAINVDLVTGAWTTDGMAMLYVPRHFLMGLIRTVREALKRRLRSIIFMHPAQMRRIAGVKWSQQTGLSGIDMFHHYMRRLSQRGWPAGRRVCWLGLRLQEDIWRLHGRETKCAAEGVDACEFVVEAD